MCAPSHSESNRYQEPGPVVSGQMLDPKESVSKVENINIVFLESEQFTVGGTNTKLTKC